MKYNAYATIVVHHIHTVLIVFDDDDSSVDFALSSSGSRAAIPRTAVEPLGPDVDDNVGAGIFSDGPNVAVSGVFSATGPCSISGALPSTASDFVGAGVG